MGSYHTSWIIVIAMNAENRQPHIKVRIFIIYMTKSE